MAFSFDRRLPGSLIAGTAATAAFWAVFVPLYRAAAPVPGMEAPAARLAHAAALLVWPALLVLLMVLAVMLSRVAAAAFDPLRDAEPQYLRVGQRVLANSVEQTASWSRRCWPWRPASIPPRCRRCRSWSCCSSRAACCSGPATSPARPTAPWAWC